LLYISYVIATKQLFKNKTISILDYTIHCIHFNKTNRIRVEDLEQILSDLENNEIITLK